MLTKLPQLMMEISSKSMPMFIIFGVLFAAGIIGATPLVKMAVERLREMGKCGLVVDLLEPVFLVAILLIATAYFVDGSFSPFLYFRF